MSGHSKWSTIKHKKAVKDARRGKLFNKLIKDLTISARTGGSDVSANPRLRTALAAAKAASMPNDTIERAIKKGAGELEGVHYEEVVYEGHGPGGVAIMLQVLTDNKNRTVAEIRHFLTKHGGSLGTSNSVAWMFDKKGIISVEAEQVDEDQLMEIVLEAGAEDVSGGEGAFEVVTSPEDFDAVHTALEQADLAMRSAEVTLIPQNTVSLSGKEAEQAYKLLDVLQEHDDIQSVAANCEFSEDDFERLSAA
ncbi:MAG: YebC/PmpR family DNA-binding transcriptional regulator [Desulfurellaceae bacterium]|nr:YebC/PmpR family DNA-binding transcriptional regulator [Desulfurellaceae bacterium]